MLERSRKKSLTGYLLIALGVFSTMPIVGIFIGERSISFFTILLPISIVYLASKGFSNKYTGFNGIITFSLFLIVSLISSFIGALYFIGNSTYSGVSLSYVPKIILYLCLTVVVFTSRVSTDKLNLVLKGFFIGAVLNLIWAAIDGIVFYSIGISINNQVFQKYIILNDIRYGQLSLTNNGTIRTGGFNYDPAHIGYLAPIVFLYGVCAKKYWYVILSIVGLLTSQSTLGLFCCLIMFFMILLNRTYRKILLRIIIIALILFIIILASPLGVKILQFVKPMFQRIMMKFNMVSQGSDTPVRIIYSFYFLQAAIYAPFPTLFGTGFGTASYPFYLAGLMGETAAFDPENTYVCYLFDTGIIGVVLYVLSFVTILKFLKRRKKTLINDDIIGKILYSAMFSLMISSIFYHYILYAAQMIPLIFGLRYVASERYRIKKLK